MPSVVEWLQKAIADPNLAPLRKLLRRRDLPPKVRSSVEAYIEADRDLYAQLQWTEGHTCKLSESRECGSIPILATSNQNRWKDGNRERQYEQLRQLIEEVGGPLKRELVAKGFTDEEIRPRIGFAVKLTADGEMLDVEPTAHELDFDPADSDRWAAEFEAARRGGCDRNGIWHPVFTLNGRVHGYFKEDESRQFDWEWQKKHGDWPKYERLLLDRVTVTLTATPSDQRWYDTLPPAERRDKIERKRKAMEDARAAREARLAPAAGPIYSASFLDFPEGKDPPVRFERGDHSQDRKSRAVDRKTGQYVRFVMLHWDDPTRGYDLYSPDGTKLCSATVEQDAIDLSGDGTVGLYKIRILSIHELSGEANWSEVTDPASQIAQKLPRFIAAYWLDNGARHSAEIAFDLAGEVR